jgi:hypothetical protein
MYYVTEHTARNTALQPTGPASGNFRQQCLRVPISHNPANTDITRILKTYYAQDCTTLWRKKKVKALYYPILPYFRNTTAFWKLLRLCPFVLLVREMRR